MIYSFLNVSIQMTNHQEIQRTKAFIRDLENLSGWTVSRMAKDAGFAHTTLSRFMNTENPKHNLKFSTLSAIAQNLLLKLDAAVSPHSRTIVERLMQENDGMIAAGMAPDDIETVWRLAQIIEKFGIPTENNEQALQYSAKELRIVDIAQANYWQQGSREHLNTTPLKTVSYPYELYPDTVVGVEIRDDSMNKRFPEGSLLICTPESEGTKIEAGAYYIVMREDTYAQSYEITCKSFSLMITSSFGFILKVPPPNTSRSP